MNTGKELLHYDLSEVDNDRQITNITSANAKVNRCFEQAWENRSRAKEWRKVRGHKNSSSSGTSLKD